ncbi:hypothetical protein [Kibdelosporangium aridum]
MRGPAWRDPRSDMVTCAFRRSEVLRHGEIAFRHGEIVFRHGDMRVPAR